MDLGTRIISSFKGLKEYMTVSHFLQDVAIIVCTVGLAVIVLTLMDRQR